jgi:predicted nuclease of predicted toxin-antitoxin system
MSAPALRFLADESCDFGVVRALRSEGYDVFAVSEVMHRSDDRELIDRAYREKRILLTEDKDFGRLVFVSHADSAGVILIRFPGNLRQTLFQTIVQLVQEQGARLLSAFVVVQPGHIRIRRKP